MKRDANTPQISVYIEEVGLERVAWSRYRGGGLGEEKKFTVGMSAIQPVENQRYRKKEGRERFLGGNIDEQSF